MSDTGHIVRTRSKRPAITMSPSLWTDMPSHFSDQPNTAVVAEHAASTTAATFVRTSFKVTGDLLGVN